ncbi:MAG: hypothetical protein AB8B83_07060 [Bdellovibrionales bacterium]
MSYRSDFFTATDETAYTAIRHEVDGTISEISGIGAPGSDLQINNGFDNGLDGGPSGMR